MGKENENKNELPLLYDIIYSAINETNANYFEVIGVLNLILSEMLDEVKFMNEQHNNGNYDGDVEDDN